MCGIAGIAGSNWSEDQLRRMVAVQTHRGPDGSAIYVDPSHRCGLGHNRLSIIDLTRSGQQPMAGANGMHWLVFNGEIYNFVELRRELSDYPFANDTDSEVILAAYERWGEACVDRFIGMFAFAIWDSEKGTLFCARDRLGIKPFHYCRIGDAFCFASEIKALLAAGHQARADHATWARYLVHGIYDDQASTFFDGVSTLPPGHTLKWRDGAIEISRYWEISRNASDMRHLDRREAMESLDHLISNAVDLRLRSDVPLGVNLSGGLDSSLLFAFVDQSDVGEASLNFFTAGFDDPQYDEAGFADGVPRRKNWIHHVERLGPEQAWDLIDPLMWHEEAPFGGIATLAYYNLHRRIAEEGVTVVLEGQGVDELFAGYAYYQQPARDGVYQDGTSFLKPELLRDAVRDATGGPPAYTAPFESELGNRLFRDTRHAKLPRVLRMNDRLSMAHSRELRVPFLDHRVVELAFGLGDDLKIRDGVGKFVMRELLDRKLGASLGKIGKRAVVTPQREWIRGPLKDRIGDLIESEHFRHNPYFDVDAVRKAFRSYCDGEGDNAFFIWQWINYDRWSRAFGATAS